MDIPNQYENVELDAYVIMPNYIHGIIIINQRAQASSAPTISQIMRSYKSKCANEYLKYVKHNNLDLSCKIWQRNYYDHVIRNEESLNKIREYILNNPLTWDKDKNNNNHNKSLHPILPAVKRVSSDDYRKNKCKR